MSYHPPLPIAYTHQNPRPSIGRSRSHSQPTSPQDALLSERDSVTTETSRPRPKRPSHGRSHSYISSTPKSRDATTLSEVGIKDPQKHRLHMPGKHHIHHLARSHSFRRDRDHDNEAPDPQQAPHRSHQRTTQTHHRLRKSDSSASDSLPNLVAGIASERDKNIHKRTNAMPTTAGHSKPPPGHRYAMNAHDHTPATVPGLTRMMSNRSYRGHGGADATRTTASTMDSGATRYDLELRRRATSDARSLGGRELPTARRKTSVEAHLDRAERLKRQRQFTTSAEDVKKREQELEEAEEEMRERLEDINRTGIDITRRLDYGYYNLLEKVGGLVEGVRGLRSVEDKVTEMVGNWEKETDFVDHDTREKLKRTEDGFDGRRTQVDALEARGRKVSTRAEELGKRLEKARAEVEAWERREEKRARRMGRITGTIWCTVLAMICILLAVVVERHWALHREHGEAIRQGLGAHIGDRHGRSGIREVVHLDSVPDDVKQVLRDIDQRNRGHHPGGGVIGTSHANGTFGIHTGSDHRESKLAEESLRALDDL